MKIIKIFVFGVALIAQLISWIMLLRDYGGWVDYNSNETILWVGLFVVSIILVLIFMPEKMRDDVFNSE